MVHGRIAEMHPTQVHEHPKTGFVDVDIDRPPVNQIGFGEIEVDDTCPDAQGEVFQFGVDDFETFGQIVAAREEGQESQVRID